MYAPETYAAALVLMVVSMVCWGSWPNFLKGMPGWRLEYFYFDYCVGFTITAMLYGLTLGSFGAGPGFVARLTHAGHRELAMALIGGFVWNIGNILLLNSIMIAGLAVAFPVAAVPALVLGIGSSYYVQPIGNPLVLILGISILVGAGQVTSAAYRRLRQGQDTGKPKGIGVALVSGMLIGAFPPFVAAAISGHTALDSYSVSLLFVIGAFGAGLVALPVLIKFPLIGERGSMKGLLGGTSRWHLFGLLAGFVWCSGTLFNFISAGMVGVAISMGIGSGAPAVGALWGILAWKEFKAASVHAKQLIALAVTLYIIGISSVAIAYSIR